MREAGDKTGARLVVTLVARGDGAVVVAVVILVIVAVVREEVVGHIREVVVVVVVGEDGEEIALYALWLTISMRY